MTTTPPDNQQGDPLGTDQFAGQQAQAVQIVGSDILNGEYEVRERIGGGGNGDVYRVYQKLTELEFALKLIALPPGAEEAKTLNERVKAELVAHYRVSEYEHIVTLHEGGYIDEAPVFRGYYIRLELLEGHCLREEIASNGPLERKRAIRLFKKALAALGEAHKLGIVHKDLKPENLFLANPGSKDEQIKVLDFGIAHLMDQHRITKGHLGPCTPHYVAPEYARSKAVSPALDVYQMGLVLAEMLTGSKVNDAVGYYQCLYRAIEGALTSPDEALQSLLDDRRLGAILRKALAKDPASRYVDCAAFLKAFDKPITIDEKVDGDDDVEDNEDEVANRFIAPSAVAAAIAAVAIMTATFLFLAGSFGVSDHPQAEAPKARAEKVNEPAVKAKPSREASLPAAPHQPRSEEGAKPTPKVVEEIADAPPEEQTRRRVSPKTPENLSPKVEPKEIVERVKVPKVTREVPSEHGAGPSRESPQETRKATEREVSQVKGPSPSARKSALASPTKPARIRKDKLLGTKRDVLSGAGLLGMGN